MAKILMCKPDYYGIEYEINPWMKKTNQANTTLAKKQWQQLYQLLLKCDAKVELLEPINHLPDLVFTANAGLILPHKKVYLSYFRYPERQGECQYFRMWFKKNNFIIINDCTDKDETVNQCSHFEGAGDGLLVGNTLFAAYGFRSEKSAFDIIKQHGIHDIVYCELQDPYFYHLDTCFCPLDNNRAIWWPDAFTFESQQRMQAAKELIAVSAKDAKHFACNSVIIGKNVILPTHCPDTSKLFKKLGYITHPTPMSEFIKSGGACKCLTLQLS